MILDIDWGKEETVRSSLRRIVPASTRRQIRELQRMASYIPRQIFGTITSVNTAEPAVAFTFDDGPHPVQTPRFLEMLEAHGARGTFFLIGESAQRHPELVQRILEKGHAVGNHSWDHSSFPALSARERRRQIRDCEKMLKEKHGKIFRPPYGNQTFLSRLDPLWLGCKVVTWNICGMDWRGETAECIADRILTALRPGSIVLLHDRLYRYEDVSYASRDATLEALAIVLKAMADQYRFVTVPELLRLGRPNCEFWIQPGQADYLAALKSGET